jgi:flagellar hook assembly protein FlgD
MVSWDGTDEAGSVVPNGVYFFRIDLGSSAHYGKIIVLR